MKLLWQEDRLTARHIREQLYSDASKAQHGTVQRLMQRLEDKGYVERDRSLSVHFFSAKIDSETYTAIQLESLATKLTGGSLALVFIALLNVVIVSYSIPTPYYIISLSGSLPLNSLKFFNIFQGIIVAFMATESFRPERWRPGSTPFNSPTRTTPATCWPTQ